MSLDTTYQYGDAGISIIATAAGSISGATNLQITFYRPDKSIEYLPATFLTNGLDGSLVYISQSGDLTPAGIFHYQGRYTLNGNTQHTQIDDFKVLENIWSGY